MANRLRIMQAAMTGVAVPKSGLTDPNDLDPRRDGRDPVPGQRTD